MSTFEESNLNSEIKQTIAKSFGFEEQTLIQEKSIPRILEGKDILGESATGSGKTLAFGVGVEKKVQAGKGLQALIITPTRELTDQVSDYITQLVHRRIKVVTIYGGVAINPQIDDLKKSEVAVVTPGRFKDHLQRGTVDTSNVGLLILDEADRMLDMGFIEDIEDIIQACPKNRQTLFFSATMPPTIHKLAQKYLKDPVKISATKMVDPKKLRQEYYDVEKNMKFSLLVHLLKTEGDGLSMIFCNTRRTTDIVVNNLQDNGIKAVALHGGYTQNKRNNVIEQVKNGRKKVLVCTDVAARGIHIDGISRIYNYEVPNDPTDYVHRIGRTARAGEEGKVINLLSEQDHDNFGRLLNEHKSYDIRKAKKPYVEKVSFKISDTNSNSGFKGRSSGPRSRFNDRNQKGRGQARGNGNSRSQDNRRQSYDAPKGRNQRGGKPGGKPFQGKKKRFSDE